MRTLNAAFREYTTSSAFVITLSKNQVDALAHVVENGEGGCRLSGLVVSSLTRRGLIEISGSGETKIGGKVVGTYVLYRPTFAGKLMYRLLYEAGLISSNMHPIEVCPIDCTKEEWDAFDEEIAALNSEDEKQ